MDEVQKIIDKIIEKPYIMDMGAMKIASWLRVSPDSVREAKRRLHREALLKTVPLNKEAEQTAPKILILDIETAPNKAYVWDVWNQNVNPSQLLSSWFMLSWSGKWLLEEETFSQRLSREEVLHEDDCRIVETLWHLLNQADVVIAHNGEKFDIPRIRTRFLIHGLPPTTYYQQIDTLKQARSQFAFPHNKLDSLANYLGIDGKTETSMALWVKCLEGDEEALKNMELYNRNDIRVLEEIYIKMRPYIKGHPNYNLFIDSERPVCPHCGHDHLEFASYYYFTQTGKYKNYRCMKCGALSRDRKSVLQNRKFILISNDK